MTVDCKEFSALDYEFLLERGQSIALFNGTKGVIEKINKPYLRIKLAGGREETNIHWMNVKEVIKD